MQVNINPSKLKGKIMAPPSKSMAHRLLICAGLSNGESTVSGISFSKDITATLNCLKALGASYKTENDKIIIKGVNPATYSGKEILNCNECGSTLRFMIPICLTGSSEIKLTGSPVLMARPLGIYEDIAKNQNLGFNISNDILSVSGPLSAGNYKISGNISSQFVSGLLFSLPLLKEDSTLEIIPPIESKPYIDMTLEALSLFGINIEEKDENIYFIKGNQSYKSAIVNVEGDYSNAAFLEAFNLIGSEVEVLGLNPESLQGDKAYYEMFYKLKNSFCTFDIADCPDLAPVLFSVAALCHGGKFTGTKRLKWKECNRGVAMKEELSKCQIKLDIAENEIIVHKGTVKAPTDIISSHNDHRIAMAMTVVLSRVGGIIDGAEAVNKSYPDFFDNFKKLGGEVECIGMDK